MIALLQRVRSASVSVDEKIVGAIEQGLLIFLCAEPDDNETIAQRFIERLLNYRMFADGAGKMNRSVRDINGGVLLVPQFTLAADTGSGLRPGFSQAAKPEFAQQLFAEAWQYLRQQHPASACGVFGADMQVALINDGPVSFWLRS